MKLSHKITYIFFKTLSFCLRISPQWIKTLLSNILYIILYYLVPIRKKQVFKNLNLAFHDKSFAWYFKTGKDSYKFFINNFIQFFAFPKSYLKSTITVKGQNLLYNTLKDGKGIIFVSGHFGAWEILGAWLGYNKYPVTAVAVRQKNRGSKMIKMIYAQEEHPEHMCQVGSEIFHPHLPCPGCVDKGVGEIESGVNLTRQTVQNIEKLGVTIQETVRSIDQIVKDSDDQIECTSEVYNIVGQLDIGLVESAEKIKQNLLILNDLLETSETIKDKIIGIDYNHKNKKCYKF